MFLNFFCCGSNKIMEIFENHLNLRTFGDILFSCVHSPSNY
jgi:hypothetical protein